MPIEDKNPIHCKCTDSPPKAVRPLAIIVFSGKVRLLWDKSKHPLVTSIIPLARYCPIGSLSKNSTLSKILPTI